MTETVVATFLADLKRDGRSLATCATYLRTLAAFFRSAHPQESPITPELIKRWSPYKKRKKGRPHYFTSVEYHALLAACEHIEPIRNDQRSTLWWKTFISILYNAAVRLNEAAHLIWRDVDFENSILRIQPHIKLSGVLDWYPKGKQRRAIPVPAQVTDFLVQIQHAKGQGIPYVFLTARRYADLFENAPKRDLLCDIGKGFRRLREAAGIAEGTIHDMQRTCITNWAKHPELKPNDVQILAGHEDLNTTLEIYTMVEEDDVVARVSRLLKRSASIPAWISEAN